MKFEDIFKALIKSSKFKIFNKQFQLWLMEKKGNNQFIVSCLNDSYEIENHKDKMKPLEYAVSNNNSMLVNLFLTAGASVDFKILSAAIHIGHEQTLESLLQNLTDYYVRAFNRGESNTINFVYAGLLCALNEEPNLPIQNLLIKYALLQPNSNNELLALSVQYGCFPLLNGLLQQNIDLYVIKKRQITLGFDAGLTMPEIAWDNNQWAIADYLFEQGYNANFQIKGMRLIHRAINCPPAVDSLVKHGANVDFMAGDFASPVALAAVSGEKEYLSKLLAHGANPNGDLQDNPPPIMAIEKSSPNFITISEMLLGHKDFDINRLFIPDASNRLPLYELLRNKEVRLFKYLLNLSLNKKARHEIILFGLSHGSHENTDIFNNAIVNYYYDKYENEIAKCKINKLITELQTDKSFPEEVKSRVINGLTKLNEYQLAPAQHQAIRSWRIMHGIHTFGTFASTHDAHNQAHQDSNYARATLSETRYI